MEACRTLSISLTNRCPLRCSFCCVPPGPGDMPEEAAISIIDQAIALQQFEHIGFTGGEPMLRLKTIAKLTNKINSNDLSWGMTTGLGWANNESKALDGAKTLVDLGINNVTVSADSGHHTRSKANIVEKFIDCLAENGVSVSISSTYFLSERESEVKLHLKTSKGVVTTKNYVAPVGFAEGRSDCSDAKFSLYESYCPLRDGGAISIWPDGRVYPCCSTYIVNKDSDLVYGNIYEESLKSIVEKMKFDPYLYMIMNSGFSSLILAAKDFEWNNVFNSPIQDSCHLCQKITKKLKSRQRINYLLYNYVEQSRINF